MLFLAATEKFERGLGGGETEVAGEEGVVDESEFFGYFLFSALFDVLFVNLPYNCVRG